MKKALLALILVVCFVGPALALNPGEAPGYGKWDLGSTNHPWKDLILTGDAYVDDGVVFTGTTYNTTINAEEPSSAGTLSFPDPSQSTGTVQLAVANSGDVSATAATSSDAYPYSMVTNAGTVDIGDSLRITFFGKKTGDNDVGYVKLQLGVADAEATVLTVTVQATDDYFHGEFFIAVNGVSDAFVSGWVIGDTIVTAKTGNASAVEYTTKDFTTEAVSYQIAIICASGSDSLAIYNVITEQL